MINDGASVPRDDVPEADWAEQQAGVEPEPSTAAVDPGRSSTTEADTADLADQDLEVVLDEED